MYKVDIQNKKLVKIPVTTFNEQNLKERFDIEEWIVDSPEILGESLLVISKEYILPSGKRLDLLAIDLDANLVIIELKRDVSGNSVEWQAIKYASYCSSFNYDEICEIFALYKSKYFNMTFDLALEDSKRIISDFVGDVIEELNNNQRIILVAKEFNSEVISAVLWLREFEVDIECVRLTPYYFNDGDITNILLNSEIIIPLLEAKDYIQKKETKQKEIKELKKSNKSSFSLEKSDLSLEDLKNELTKSLSRPSDLTPRLIAFFKIISKENRTYKRNEILTSLYEFEIGKDIGQTGRYLSNVSQFLTKASNPHLRQLVDFETGGKSGQFKDNFYLVDTYRSLVNEVLNEIE